MAAGGSIWARGRAMEAPARGVEGGGSSGTTRGEARQAGGGFLAIAQRRAALRCLPRREVEEQAGGESVQHKSVQHKSCSTFHDLQL